MDVDQKLSEYDRKIEDTRGWNGFPVALGLMAIAHAIKYLADKLNKKS